MAKGPSRLPVIHTPVDRLTGLPHAILPFDTESGLENGHHHQFPSTHLVPLIVQRMLYECILEPEDLTLQELGGLVVRMSRVQVLPVEVHVLTHQKLLGPQLPDTLDQKFEAFVRAYLGAVSRWAVDVRKPADDGDGMLVYMSDDVFERVASRKRLNTERAGIDYLASYRRRFFGNFLLRYAMEQDMGHISPTVIDQFLDTQDEYRRKELGNFILTEALETKIAPIVPIHQHLLQQGLVQPGRADDARMMVRNLIDKNRLPALFPALTNRLLAAA